MIYDVIYLIAAVVTLPYFIIKAACFAKYRAGIREKLGWIPTLPALKKDTVWFHCVSVGEVLAAALLVKEFRRAYPEYAVAVSTTTDTGRSVAEKQDMADFYFYYPFDFSWIVSRVLSALRPRILVLTELEIWPNMVRQACRRGIPIGVVNGRLSARSFRRFRMVRFFSRNVFSKLAFCSVQDNVYRERFIELGSPEEGTVVGGNMKYDALTGEVDPEKYAYMKKLLQVREQDLILMGGSTHEGEEQILLQAYAWLLPQHENLRLILVPRHPERIQAVCSAVEKAGFRYCLKTELTGDENDVGDRVVIVDTMGELSMLYAISTVAFVGGSFSNTGGQNMLEPAVLKKPVIVGPSTFNFEEDMKRLRGENGVREVKTAEECIEAVHSLLNDPEERKILGENGFNVVQQFKGAVQKNLKILEKYI